MHTMKLKANDISAVLKENSNTEDLSKRDGHSKVGNVDLTRTHLNYNLCGNELRQSAELVKERIEELGVRRKIKSDAVLALSTIIDRPSDLPSDISNEDFFFASYRALTEKFCNGDESKVLQAYVHLDETTPHMHFVSIPVVETEKGMKLSAKDLCNKTFLQTLHKDIQEKVSQELGCEVHLYSEEKCRERQEAREKGDRSLDYETLEGFKARKESENLKNNLENDIIDLEFSKMKTEGKNKSLREEAERLKMLVKQGQSQVSALQSQVSALSQQHNNLSRANVEISQKLSEAQISLEKLQGDINTLADEKKGLETKIEPLRGEMNKLQTENNRLKTDNEKLNERIEKHNKRLKSKERRYDELQKYMAEASETYLIDFGDVDDVIAFIGEELDKCQIDIGLER